MRKLRKIWFRGWVVIYQLCQQIVSGYLEGQHNITKLVERKFYPTNWNYVMRSRSRSTKEFEISMLIRVDQQHCSFYPFKNVAYLK